MRETIEAFWRRCQAAVPALTGVSDYGVRTFANDEALTRRLIDLVRARVKTGTFAVDWDFEARPADRPTPGRHYVVVDHAGAPQLVIRMLLTEVVPFGQISETHTQCEGEALRALGPWREVHWDYWSRTLAAIGRQPAPDMPILFQRFELVYPP